MRTDKSTRSFTDSVAAGHQQKPLKNILTVTFNTMFFLVSEFIFIFHLRFHDLFTKL